MKSMKVLMVVAVMTVAGSAFAQTITPTTGSDDEIAVSAEVARICEINATDLDFGTYDASTGASTPAPTATITARCTAESTLVLSIDDGANPNGTQNQMMNGTTPLEYEASLGAETGGSLVNGEEVSYEVTGSINAGQWTAVAGSYTDTITVTVTF